MGVQIIGGSHRSVRQTNSILLHTELLNALASMPNFWAVTAIASAVDVSVWTMVVVASDVPFGVERGVDVVVPTIVSVTSDVPSGVALLESVEIRMSALSRLTNLSVTSDRGTRSAAMEAR